METPSPVGPFNVVLAFDATKDRTEDELNLTIDGEQKAGGILRAGDTLVVLGVLHKVMHPMGIQFIARPNSIAGTSIRAMEEEVSKKIDLYVNMLQESAERCEDQGVKVEVRVTSGFPIKHVIFQEVAASKASWVILDRHLRRDLKWYLKQISSEVALIHDNLNVEVLRPHTTSDTDDIEHKLFYSSLKPVTPSRSQDSISTSSRSYLSSSPGYQDSDPGQSVIFCRSFPPLSFSSQENSGLLKSTFVRPSSSYRPQGDKSFQNVVPNYKQETSDIQTQGENKYSSASQSVQNQQNNVNRRRPSEAPILCFACGIRTALYIKDSMRFSFPEIQLATNDFSKDKEATVLEWHQRHAIAIGNARGLRFLHEECRGGPIIHRDLRPGNILLTHDFVPMVTLALPSGRQVMILCTRGLLGTLGYLAPEYVEEVIVSVRTDVYAFGIVLLQLMTGRTVINENIDKQQQSLRQWAEPLIERVALHELIDPRLGESYDTYELYIMAKTAYLCLLRSPVMRPSMKELVRYLEAENEHFHHLAEEYIPQYTK